MERTGEDIADELVKALRADVETGMTLGDSSDRRRSDVVKWTEKHGEAVVAALRTALAQGDPLKSSFSAPILALGDVIAAYGSGDPDVVLRPWPARVSGLEDGPVMGVLTSLTDVSDLLSRLFKHVPKRPRYRTDPPRVPASLGAEIDPVELAEYLGFRPAEAADLWAGRLTARQEGSIVDALIARALRDEPQLGSVIDAVHRADPSALVATPFVRLFASVLRGVRGPGGIELVHIIDLNGSGELALVIVPSSVRTDLARRAHLCAYLRDLADHRIAPWRRWRRPRDRREGLALYARRVSGLRPGMLDVANGLRERHADDYADEAVDVTLRRIRRISAEIRRVRIPRSMRAQFRQSAARQGFGEDPAEAKDGLV